jgi:hypothetical protein
MTLEIFQSCGNVPSDNDLLNMIVKWFAIVGAAESVALFMAIFHKRLSISCWDTSWKWKRAFETLMY